MERKVIIDPRQANEGQIVTCPSQCGGFPKGRMVRIATLASGTRPIDILCRQVNMDYSLAQVLGYNMQGMSDVVTFYDINCLYMKKLWSRVANNAYIEIWPKVTITPEVGIWHVHGHWPECYARYVPLFISGIRWVDGEVLEILWSLLNNVSGSTWSMTSGAAGLSNEWLQFHEDDQNEWV